MKLLAISSPEFIPDEAALINSLFREGLVCLHIRKPKSNEDVFANLLSQIEPEFLGRISIHQHHQLAEEFGLKRLHFPELERKNASEEKLKILTEKGLALSTSIHNLEDMDSLPSYFSYTFFGPAFNSISKSGYKGVLPEDFFLKNETRKIKIIALGGISTKNLEKVREMNFDGAAVLGTLWNEPDNVINKFRELRDVLDFINQHHNHDH
jgi:thiamine-phosphate pyrophosphorylase